MTPVAISTSERGQISIFFSASIIVLISIVAFVINIGLFVKAKINLQNATDAAAFSGAAVQARQLTKIAYLNWEMRNIYKEWMYKYYVVGNLNIQDVENPTGGGAMSFRLQQDRNPITAAVTQDPFNFPAVCIHLANSKTNICKRYAIPGLPEFGSSNLPGAEEASRAFMDVLISSKTNDCIDRTRLNMLVNLTWAFNVLVDNSLDDILVRQGPAILANRQGAWPRAVELAMRMRNLERSVNREAETSRVCESPGLAGDIGCSKSINDIVQDKQLGSERVTKAFYSALRNLGNEVDREMKDSFTMTEIPPTPVESLGQRSAASYLLIPSNNQYQKQYLDLHLMMVNYATFYAAMIPRADTKTSGACDVSKVAIPVPGYPLGFYKNPELLTYYAVRGEANFSGMFNPFDANAVKLTAYSAAKPFGGRIGPMLFLQRPGTSFFVGRNDPSKRRSVPYIATLDLSAMPARGGQTLGNGRFIPGLPLPINFDNTPGYFWIKDETTPLGGAPSGGDVQFGIPNMVYEYETPYTNTGYTNNLARLNIIRPAVLGSSSDNAFGLFSKSQFAAFKGSRLTGNLTQDLLEDEIARVRAATVYETANYLIPTPNKLNIDNGLDSFGAISGKPRTRSNGVQTYNVNFFAPLYSGEQQDVLWKTSADVVRTIFDYIRTQETAVTKYRASLNRAAQSIYDMRYNIAAEAGGSIPGYEKAAAGVSDITFSPTPGNVESVMNQKPKSCASLAGQFLEFFYGGQLGQQVDNNAGCPQPLGNLLNTYFSTVSGSYNPNYYKFEYNYFPANMNKGKGTPKKEFSLFTAYMPGRMTGVSTDGLFDNPIAGSDIQERMRRNFYSTKFITLDSLQKGRPGFDENSGKFPIYSEGRLQQGNPDTTQSNFKNPLDAASVGIDVSNIKY